MRAVRSRFKNPRSQRPGSHRAEGGRGLPRTSPACRAGKFPSDQSNTGPSSEAIELIRARLRRTHFPQRTLRPLRTRARSAARRPWLAAEAICSEGAIRAASTSAPPACRRPNRNLRDRPAWRMVASTPRADRRASEHLLVHYRGRDARSESSFAAISARLLALASSSGKASTRANALRSASSASPGASARRATSDSTR